MLVVSIEAPTMPKPRLRFREFLLLITLASMITAAFAIRARIARHESLYQQSVRFDQARNSVKAWEDQIDHMKRRLENMPPISEAQAARCELRLMPAVKDVADIPTRGKNLIIIADVDDGLSFRMFDADGRRVLKDDDAWYIDGLKTDLADLWPPHELTEDDKRWLIASALSVIGANRAFLQTYLRRLEASHAKAVGDARQLERLVGRPWGIGNR
jgi:hypothetical protein